MARTRVQFNASTLKASYINANDTAQTIDGYSVNCDNCPTPGLTPSKLTAGFSGLTNCTDCYNCSNGDDWSADFSGDIASVVNGNTYTLTQILGEECYWANTYSGSYGSIDWWESLNCSGAADATYTLDRMYIVVGILGADAFFVRILFWCNDSADSILRSRSLAFQYDNTMPIGRQNCVDNCDVSNELSCGNCYTDPTRYWIACENGTAEVDEY